MSQTFTFPPPPPPPPRQDGPPDTFVQNNFTPSRGRGGRNNSFRGTQPQRSFGGGGRGRGYGTRGSYFDARNGGPASGRLNQRGRGFPPNTSRQQSFSAPSDSSPTEKRTHVTAFGNTFDPKSRPKAPPAVPSFSADIDNLLAKKEANIAPKPSPAPRKANMLGLTPSNQEPESKSDEEDVDDETNLAAGLSQDGYTFNHRGQTMSLRTPAEIAAWIAERKKKYPTKTKVEAAKLEAEEKKKQWEQRKKQREEELRFKQDERARQYKEREKQKLKQRLLAEVMANAKAEIAKKNASTSSKAASKAERLRKRVEEATRQLKIAEEALEKANARNGQVKTINQVFEPSSTTNADDGSTVDVSGAQAHDHARAMVTEGVDSDISDEEAICSDSLVVDDTSSSGSSESDGDIDLDSAPEEASTKRDLPERIQPSIPVSNTPNRRLCQNMARLGRCKFGKKCRFSHELPQKDKLKSKTSTTPARRKSLYQVMVEKEKEEQQIAAMKAIISLGQKGYLKDDTEQQVIGAAKQSNGI